jgi:hypothetical protein
MRNILVATLALSPVLLHAQTQSAAQTGAHAPVLESRLVSPKPVDSAASANVVTVTTSLVVPRLVKWGNIPVEHPDDSMNNQERLVKVSMTVTEQGVPTHLKIVDSADPLINQSVLDAVANYRFAPASYDSKPTAMPLVLTVRVLPHTN